MSTIYNIFKRYGRQTDRTGYTIAGIQVVSVSGGYHINW